MKYRIVIGITTLAVVVAASIFMGFPRDHEKGIKNNSSDRDFAGNSPTSSESGELATVPRAIVRELDDSPNSHNNQPLVEIVTSIYEQDPTYRDMAQRVVEEMVKHHETSRYLRWEPVRIEPSQIIDGSYLKDGAIPRSLAIAPFRDARFVVDQTNYTIYSENDGAIWEGEIRGFNYGKVIITIGGGIDTPSLEIGIYSHQNRIHVFPTDVATVYIAIEIDPTKAQ
jgi:hypothetical protein